MIYYWKEKDLIVEDGVARPPKNQDVDSLPLFEDTDVYKQSKTNEQHESIKQQIQLIEQKAMRNVIALAKQESEIERQYLNERIAEIESLREQLRG